MTADLRTVTARLVPTPALEKAWLLWPTLLALSTSKVITAGCTPSPSILVLTKPTMANAQLPWLLGGHHRAVHQAVSAACLLLSPQSRAQAASANSSARGLSLSLAGKLHCCAACVSAQQLRVQKGDSTWQTSEKIKDDFSIGKKNVMAGIAS